MPQPAPAEIAKNLVRLRDHISPRKRIKSLFVTKAQFNKLAGRKKIEDAILLRVCRGLRKSQLQLVRLDGGFALLDFGTIDAWTKPRASELRAAIKSTAQMARESRPFPAPTTQVERAVPSRGEKSIRQFIYAIKRLPDEPPKSRGTSSRSEKEQWLGWLEAYDGPGWYGRSGSGYDARYAYNHIVNPYMLLWLVNAAGVDAKLARGAKQAVAGGGSTLMAKAGALRRVVSWETVANALWPPS